MEKKDNTKGKVKGYFMYEKEKQRENHLDVYKRQVIWGSKLASESLFRRGENKSL